VSTAAAARERHDHHELPTSGPELTSLPLLRAGLAFTFVAPIALASDTASIALMELVDSGIMLLIPGAMESGVGDVLFWVALAFGWAVLLAELAGGGDEPADGAGAQALGRTAGAPAGVANLAA